MLNKSILERNYLGKEIEIINMDGEPKYKGKKGVVTLIDDDLQLNYNICNNGSILGWMCFNLRS